MKTTIAGIAASALLAITMPALANGIVLVDPSATADRSKPDVEACYDSAQGQIDHDAWIERDRSAAFDISDAGLGLSALRQRMSTFGQSKRRRTLFIDCINAKGYSRG